MLHTIPHNKKILLLMTICLYTVFLIGCKKSHEKTTEITFTGQVVSLSENTLLVRPDDNTQEDVLTSQIYVPIDTVIVDASNHKVDTSDLNKANRVEITYDGVLDNSDPAQIQNCYQIKILE